MDLITLLLHRSWSKLQRSVNIFIQKEQHNCRLWKSSTGTSNSRLLFSSSRIRHLDHQRKWHNLFLQKNVHRTSMQENLDTWKSFSCKKVVHTRNLSLVQNFHQNFITFFKFESLLHSKSLKPLDAKFTIICLRSLKPKPLEKLMWDSVLIFKTLGKNESGMWGWWPSWLSSVDGLFISGRKRGCFVHICNPHRTVTQMREIIRGKQWQHSLGWISKIRL